MTRLLFAAALCCAALSSQAQTSAGTILLSGNVGYTSDKTENTPISSTQGRSNNFTELQRFEFAPQVGVFVAERLAVGVMASLNQMKTSQQHYNVGPGGVQSGTQTTRNHALRVGPFVRYYQMVGEKAAFYGQLSGGYTGAKTRTAWTGVNPASGTERARGGFADLQPGFVFFPSERLGLELALGSLSYVTMKNKPVDPPPTNGAIESRYTSFGARFGLSQLTLGASFHLGGK